MFVVMISPSLFPESSRVINNQLILITLKLKLFLDSLATLLTRWSWKNRDDDVDVNGEDKIWLDQTLIA